MKDEVKDDVTSEVKGEVKMTMRKQTSLMGDNVARPSLAQLQHILRLVQVGMFEGKRDI